MPFRNTKQYVDAMQNGRMLTSHFRKVPGLASTAGWWADLGMAAGNPPPNYYASEPLVAAILDPFRGFFHGDAKAPYEKYLSDLMITTPTANCVGLYCLMDYVLYYPFIDLDDTDQQVFSNNADNPLIPALPRYTDGKGLQAYMFAQAPTVGGGSFIFTYINQDGTEKTSPTNYCGTTGASMGSIVTSQPATVAGRGPQLNLADGDTGIRRMLTYTNLVPNSGLGVIVLAAPLTQITISEINTPVELSMVMMRPGAPRIVDGAFLAFMANTIGSVAAGILSGRMNFVWTS